MKYRELPTPIATFSPLSGPICTGQQIPETELRSFSKLPFSTSRKGDEYTHVYILLFYAMLFTLFHERQRNYN